MLSEKTGKNRYAENRGNIAAACRAEWSGKSRKKTEKNSGRTSYRGPIWNMIAKYQV